MSAAKPHKPHCSIVNTTTNTKRVALVYDLSITIINTIVNTQ